MIANTDAYRNAVQAEIVSSETIPDATESHPILLNIRSSNKEIHVDDSQA